MRILLLLLCSLPLACTAPRESLDDDDAADDDDSAATGDDDDATASDDDDTTDDDDAAPDPTVTMVSPGAGTIFENGAPIAFVAQVSDPTYPVEQLQAAWTADGTDSLGTLPVGFDGSASPSPTTLDPGWHDVEVRVTNPGGGTASDSVSVGVCDWAPAETFDSTLSGWTAFGDASWDPSGFLELTGNFQDRAGQLFNTDDVVSPGDVGIRFSIQTGPNVGNGADGFALSIIDAADPADLAAILATTANGGGLAYGYGGPYGSLVRDALHVEIDTWHNVYNGTTELHTDPTPDNHIAITLDGNPGDHLLWAPVPDIEDMAWHEVVVDIEGDHIHLELDNVTLIDDTLTGWSFRGGYIGFSGSTGFYTNVHRVDDLQILDECLVP